MAILNHGSTIRTADGGQSTTTIVTASNIGSYAVASNATYYIGTTQNVFNRASGAQTLTGVSIDGNAATVTNGVYTTGAQTIGGTKTFSDGVVVNSAAYNTFGKPSPNAYQTVTLFGSASGGLFFTTDNAIIGTGAYYNNGWIATATSGRNIDFAGGNFTFTAFSGATVGGAASFGTVAQLTSAGVFSAIGDFRAPIFYDSGNTSYYLDPANSGNSLLVAGSVGVGTTSTSQKLHVVGNIIVAPASSSWAEGLSFTMPTTSTWGGLRWRREVANADGNHYVGYTGLDSTDDLVFGSNNGGTQINNNIRITKAGLVGVGTIPTQKFHVSGIGYSDTDFRAPIFYDSNDTAYYVNPNSVSNLSSLRIFSAFDTASSDVYANMRVMRNNATNDGMYIGYGNNSTGTTKIFGGGATTGELTKYSNYTLEPGSFRSPIFYDSDNTGYYLDAASTSNLNILGVAGRAGIGGAGSRSTNGLTVGFTDNSTFAANTDVGDTDRMLSIVNESSTTNAMAVLGFRVNPNGGTANAMLDIKYVQTGATNTSALHYTFNHGGSFLDRFTILSSGNVGIGITSPSGKLHVYNSTSVDTILESGTSGTTGKLIFKTSDNVDLNKYIMQENYYMILNGHANEGFKFRDSASNVLLSIFGSNNAYASRVGIGTQTPGYKLDVNGAINSSTYVYAGVFYDNDNTAYYANPSGASIFNGLKLVSSGNEASGSDYSLWIQGGNEDWGIGVDKSAANYGITYNLAASHTYAIQGRKNGAEYFRLGTDMLSHDTRLQAPIFYDSNNTAYYIDPASTSVLNAVSFAGNSTFSSDSHLTFGPNSSWGSSIRIGGNGYTATGTETASVMTTDGNLHLDAAKSTNGIYMNWYGGTGGVYFGNGSSGQVGYISASGNASFSGSVTTTYGNFTTPALIMGDAQYGFYVASGNVYYKSASGGAHYWRNIANSANVVSFDNSGNIINSGYINASSYIYTSTYLQTGNNNIYPNGQANTLSINVGNSANNAWVSGISLAPGGLVTAYGDMRSPIFYDSNNTAYYVDPASTSVLNRLTIDGGNYAFDYFQSLSDFTNGTLVTTDIPATAANGLSFVMEVVGKSYNTTTSPFNFNVQGYLYNSTIINYSGMSLDSTGLTTIKVFENGGFLCFWWARVSYWNAFEVSVRSYDTAKTNYNRVTNITDAVEPTGTKKVTVTLHRFMRADVSATNSVDLRAPIFYDSNDTTYYTDPSSLSNIVELKTNKNWYDGSASAWGGGINMGGNNPSIGFQSTASTWWYMFHHSSDSINFYRRSTSGGWNQDCIWDSSGNFIWRNSSVRAPIFYDFNDTAYYVDAASTSILNTIRLAGKLTNNGSVADDDGFGIYWENAESTSYAIYREAGSWTNPFPDLRIAFHTGIKLGANAGYNGIRFYNDYTMATQVMSVNNGSDGLGADNVYVNNSLQAGSSLRSPIYYDSDNTAYYINAASTSSLNALNLADSVDVGTSIYIRNNLRMLNSAGNGWLETIVRNSGSPYFTNPIDGGTFLASDTSENNNWLFQEAARGWGLFYFNRGTQSGQTFGSYTTIGAETFIIGQGSGTTMTSTWTGYNASSKVAIMLSNYTGYIWANDTIFSATGLRAPIFYDSDDTNFYANPAGESKFNYLRLTNNNALYFTTTGVAELNNEGNSTNVAFRMIKSGSSNADGNNYGVLNLQRTNHTNGATNAGASIFFELKDSGGTIREYAGLSGCKTEAGAAGGRLIFHRYARTEIGYWDADQLFANASMRSPIFYDSDNTAYYLNPAGNSQLTSVFANDWFRAQGNTGLYFQDKGYGITSAGAAGNSYGNASTYGTGVNGWQGWGIGSRHCLMSNGGDNVGIHDNSRSWLYYWDGTYHRFQYGYFEAAGSVRGPIFYDSNNTSYYIDAASTSNLNALNVVDANLELYKSQTVDMSNTTTYSTSNYYPVTISVPTEGCIIQIQNNLNSNVPSWSTHPSGFTLNLKWRTNGSGWGTTAVRRIIDQYTEVFTNQTICGGITQMINSSTEVVWLRGGGQYFFKFSRNLSATAQSATYTVNSQSVSPTSSAQNTVWSSYSGAEIKYNDQTISTTNMYTPVLYDWNNSSYYVDPASTSNLVGLTVANTITGNISGSSGSCTGNAATATRTSSQSGYPHAGTGMWAFYNWGGSDGGTSAPSASTYTTGLSVGSNPGDQAYGFQIANNMWNTGLWTRNYNSSFGSWLRLLDSSNYVGYSAFTGNVDGTQFRDANNTAYYVDPASASNLNILSLVNYGYINGQTINGQSFYQWEGATYRNPADHTPQLLIRKDNSTTGLNGFAPALALYNNNGAGQTTVGMAFVSAEAASPTQGNAVELAGIIAKKESTGTAGSWSQGSLNFFIKGFASRVDAMSLSSSGALVSYIETQSPIFYDYNDTNYYLDPNSTSNLLLVKTRNTFGERVAVTAASSTTINTQYNLTELTMAAFITTLTFSNIQSSGTVHMWTIVTLGNGSATSVTWPAAIKWPGGTAPNITGTNTKRDIYQFVTYDGGTNIYAIIVGQNL